MGGRVTGGQVVADDGVEGEGRQVGEPLQIGEARRPAGDAHVDLGELGDVVVDATLGDPARAELEGPLGEVGLQAQHGDLWGVDEVGGVGRVDRQRVGDLTADEADRPVLLPGVGDVVHEAGVGLEPAGVGGRAVAGDEAEARRSVPVERQAGRPVIGLPHEGEVEDDGEVVGERQVVLQPGPAHGDALAAGDPPVGGHHAEGEERGDRVEVDVEHLAGGGVDLGVRGDVGVQRAAEVLATAGPNVGE